MGQASKCGTSVLIVEDDAPLRETFEEMLREMGYSARSAPNGKEALVHVMNERPGLIFVDLIMPVMNGFDLIDTLQNDADLASIPIVAMSGSWASKVHGITVMKKPFRAEAAIDIVRTHCGDPCDTI